MKFIEPKAERPPVPIVSLIDILAILLIFFVATSTFKEEKALVNISIPKSTGLAARVTSEPRVILAADENGDIYLGADPVPMDGLVDALATLKAERPDAKLELKADEEIPLRTLVALWDALTRSGFQIKDVPARILMQKPEGKP